MDIVWSQPTALQLPPEPGWTMFLLGALMSTASKAMIDPFSVPEVSAVMSGPPDTRIDDLDVPQVHDAIRKLVARIDGEKGEGYCKTECFDRFFEQYNKHGGMA